MNREIALAAIEDPRNEWDFIVIGGGATGLGTAVDAASRGYKTLLLEQHDFAKGTSSRSTKLIHGGVRYLKQGNISLVLEALHERGLLFQNAPHLCSHQSFIVPVYHWWEGPFYGIGLKVYDALAGKLGLQPSQMLSVEETLKRIPTLETKGLKGGVIYYDGQFDDSRLAVNLAQTLFKQGGYALNHTPVTALLKEQELVRGVVIQDLETGKEHSLQAKAVINATGVFTDQIRSFDNPEEKSLISPSQGVHLVLPKSFLPGDSAIMVPQTSDGRVLFVVPWHDRALVGTTDTPVDKIELEPRPLAEEIDFILNNAARYLSQTPQRSDVLSAFAGLRPLVKSGEAQGAALSRDHSLLVSNSGLVTITGGKWTTYRKMAEDTVNQAEQVANLGHRSCITTDLAITQNSDNQETSKNLKEPQLHPRLPYSMNDINRAMTQEMARTLEDILARRTRALLLDAQASIDIAPQIAAVLASHLGKSEAWKQKAISEYQKLAQQYLPQSQ